MRGAPKTAMAVCPAPLPSLRTVAVTWLMVRPRRSTVTSMSSGPGATWAANTVVTERSACSGWASSAVMARRARALTMPPWGSTGAFHPSLMVAR